jgi:hypothetical protein
MPNAVRLPLTAARHAALDPPYDFAGVLGKSGCPVGKRAWRIEAIEAGVRAAEAGDVFSHERVREWLMLCGKEDEREPPA